jgi:hypothetical protein
MLICRKPATGATDVDPFRYDRRHGQGPRQGGPVFLPRRRLSTFGEAVLRDDQHLSRMDDIAAQPVGALER